MRSAFISLFICFCLSSFAQQNDVNAISLDGTWRFKTDPDGKGESSNWYLAAFNDDSWDSLPVPGNWDLTNRYSSYAGKAWYRRTISVSPAWKDKLVRLLFEAVNGDSKVWLNGRLLGSSDIGYLPFSFDVSDGIRYGSNNTIVVLCDNTNKIGALWSWGGIRRPVRLTATDKVHLAAQYITPTVNLTKHRAEVAIRIVCSNQTSVARQLKGEVILSNAGKNQVQLPFTKMVNAMGMGDVIVKTVLSGKQIHLWNCDDPFLYVSQVYLESDGQRQLHLTDRFGLRKVELDNSNFTFRLNGQPMRQMGFNLIPDDRTAGNTLPLWRMKQDVDLLKSLGANMARLTHLPLPPEMFDYLDEKGILVFSEIPLWGLTQLTDTSNHAPKRWLSSLIDHNYNHPCIIGWSVGNEIGHSSDVMTYVKDAILHIKSIDTTRMGVVVSHTATRQDDPLDYSDIGLINQYGTQIGALADAIHARHPDKAIFYSEFGYGQLREDLDGDADARGMMDSIRFKRFLIGGALWTFNDYRSDYIGTKEYSGNRPWGIVDVFRRKKKAWYSFRKEYAPVQALGIETTGRDSNVMHVSITPRQLLDLPSYPLKDYVLVWQGFNEQNQLMDGSFMQLPVIKPGGQNYETDIRWKNKAALAWLKVELLSPGNYSVYDTIVYYKKPASPEVVYLHGVREDMNDTFPQSGSIHVIFNKVLTASSYKVKYGVDDLAMESASTRNNYINIYKLPYWKTYKMALVATNSAGESDIQEIKEVRIEPGLPPPVIYYTEPADKGFYIGYVTEKDDYLFKVQYTDKPGDYKSAPVIQTTSKGVLQVSGLENGKTYYFRMCRVKHNNFTTPWSEEHAIVPDGQQPPPPPHVYGVLRNNDAAIISFEPVKKAIGYIVEYRERNAVPWVTIKVNAAEIRHYKIPGLKHGKEYEFRIAAENQYARSLWTVTSL